MFGLCSRCVVGAFYKVVAFYMCIFLTFLSKLGGAYYILKRFIVRKVRYYRINVLFKYLYLVLSDAPLFFNDLMKTINFTIWEYYAESALAFSAT